MTKTNTLTIFLGAICLGFLLFGVMNTPMVDASTRSCVGGNCWTVACQKNSDCGTNQFQGNKSCQNNALYQNYTTYTCNNPGTAYASCTSVKNLQLIQSCSYNQKCEIGSHPGCVLATNNTNNISGNNNNYYSGQNYLKCLGNSVYWFDYYGNQQALYQTCSYNQTCISGACSATGTYPTQSPSPSLSCTSHAIKECVNNAVYWFDSCANKQEVYQDCSATNKTCYAGSCSAASSYSSTYGSNNALTYVPTYAPTYTTTATSTTTSTPTSTPAKATTQNQNLITTIFAKKSANSQEWQKNMDLTDKDTMYFLVTVKNTSTSPIDKVLVKVDTTENISYTKNLIIDNLASNESIISGLDLGTIPAKTSKAISFTGAANAKDGKTGIKVSVNVSSAASTDSDFMIVNIGTMPAVTTPAVTTTTQTTNSTSGITNTAAFATGAALKSPGLTSFVQKWYIWMIGIALVGLFIFIFRRLSSDI